VSSFVIDVCSFVRRVVVVSFVHPSIQFAVCGFGLRSAVWELGSWGVWVVWLAFACLCLPLFSVGESAPAAHCDSDSD